MSPACQESLAWRRTMDAKYSRTYHRKHRDERNAKTRLRMARLRSQDPVVPPEELEARLAAHREASRKYREKNRSKLAEEARRLRNQAKRASRRATLEKQLNTWHVDKSRT